MGMMASPQAAVTACPAVLVDYTSHDHRRRLENVGQCQRRIRPCLRKHLITGYLPGQCAFVLLVDAVPEDEEEGEDEKPKYLLTFSRLNLLGVRHLRCAPSGGWSWPDKCSLGNLSVEDGPVRLAPGRFWLSRLRWPCLFKLS